MNLDNQLKFVFQQLHHGIIKLINIFGIFRLSHHEKDCTCLKKRNILEINFLTER